MNIIRKPEQIYYWLINADAPRGDNSDPLQPAVVKYVFLSYRKEVLQSFLGVLTAGGITYETPRHLKVLQGILLGQRNQYPSKALAVSYRAEEAKC